MLPNNPAVGPTQDDLNIQFLKDARDNCIKQLAQITVNPKPTYEIDGQSVKWQEYAESLHDRIRKLNATINELDIGVCGTENVTQAYT